MPLFTRAQPRAKCSFCAKSHEEVQRLIAGPDVYICDVCVDTCAGIMRREIPERPAKLIELAGGLYNLDHFVALTETEQPLTGAQQWDSHTPTRQLVIHFSGGVTVQLPLTEKERIEKIIREHHEPSNQAMQRTAGRSDA